MNYLDINRSAWNQRVLPHMASEFYHLEEFILGKNSLKEIEISMLPELTGSSLLHLQCHFGQDSISLSRMGARVTGVDFSEVAISEAIKLAERCHTDTRFECADVYSVPSVLSNTFDIVFTSYGTIGWLPDADRWAYVVSMKLKTGGQFIMADFHPFLWMFDENFSEIKYSWFNTGPIIETTSGSYADKNTGDPVSTIGWNHSLDEILNALIRNGLKIEVFREYDYSPYPCFNDMAEPEPGKFRIRSFGNKAPHCYAIRAIKI